MKQHFAIELWYNFKPHGLQKHPYKMVDTSVQLNKQHNYLKWKPEENNNKTWATLKPEENNNKTWATFKQTKFKH